MAMRAEARAWWAELEEEQMRERIARRQAAAAQESSRTRRRPVRRPIERIGGQPDRLAEWAVGMAVLLVLVAALSAHL